MLSSTSVSFCISLKTGSQAFWPLKGATSTQSPEISPAGGSDLGGSEWRALSSRNKGGLG